MRFDPQTAAIRFGTGLSPAIAPPDDAAQMLAWLGGPDVMAARYPIPRFASLQPELAKIRALGRIRRKNKGSDTARAARKKIRKFRKLARQNQALWLRAAILRGVRAQDGFRERLTYFWADHFTVRGKTGVLRHSVAPYVEEAIRPHIAGRFADMLKAVVLLPMMLIYLDQYNSAGPNSVAARKKNRGLNENLGRELLELHTLGVGGSYNQRDVRELAQLLAGLSYRPDKGFVFVPSMAEPGAEYVLGQKYGSARPPALADVLAFLEDVAAHPDTARHLARKLVVHFVSDTPDAALVAHVAAAYSASGGDLSACYAALLEHDAAWEMPDKKAKQPFDFIVSSLRAIAVEERYLQALKWKDVLFYLGAPMAIMGQAWERPVGPDGWPEDVGDWITPQGLAGRIQWAMTVPQKLRPALPDPRKFVETALGERVGGTLRFAASAAASLDDGVGIILSSPEFQRH